MPQSLGYFFVNSIKIKHVKPIWSQFAYESAYDLFCLWIAYELAYDLTYDWAYEWAYDYWPYDLAYDKLMI
jgi:hypothetical protein